MKVDMRKGGNKMKKKSLITLIITSIFTFVVLTPAAHAGSVQRNRWEGIAIGLGTAIIGSALLNQSRDYSLQAHTTYDSTPRPGDSTRRHSRPEYDLEYGPDSSYSAHRHRPARKHYNSGYHKKHRRRGHWEMREKWVPPTYKKAWNPGHYSHRGKWKSGDWVKIEDRPGYWVETRVWVARR
jgi:hypothetical protein